MKILKIFRRLRGGYFFPPARILCFRVHPAGQGPPDSKRRDYIQKPTATPRSLLAWSLLLLPPVLTPVKP